MRKDFRTLSLLPHVHKRIVIKVEKRLEDDHYGFGKRNGTWEAILVLRVLTEKQINRIEVTYLAHSLTLRKLLILINYKNNINWEIMF